MEKKVSPTMALQILTLALLVLSQAVAIGFSPWAHGNWQIYTACASLDIVLLGAFIWAGNQKKKSWKLRRDLLWDELERITELTKVQQAHLKAVLDGLAMLGNEDLDAMKEAEDLIASLSRFANLTLQKRPENQQSSTGSVIDSIQTMVFLGHNLMRDLETSFQFYIRTQLRLRQIQTEYRLNHFRLDRTVDFLVEMGAQTNVYSEKLVLEVLDAFQEITHYSQGISNEVMESIHRLMDPANPQSLDAVKQGSDQIVKTMDGFFRDLAHANASSEKAETENLAQMVRVKEMAAAIAEFAESIRMISLNLNIEAARVGSGNSGKVSNRGFQVLATMLSEFAVKARELAEQQNTIIEEASSVVAKSGRTQRAQLEALMAKIPQIKAELDPFEAIVDQSYAQFEKVGATMDQLASSISEKLKAVIGKFQFQDVVRQENEHILMFLSHIRDLADQIGDAGATLNEDAKAKAFGELLATFEQLSSTENERSLLRELRSRTKLPQSESDDVTAGSVSLF